MYDIARVEGYGEMVWTITGRPAALDVGGVKEAQLVVRVQESLSSKALCPKIPDLMPGPDEVTNRPTTFYLPVLGLLTATSPLRLVPVSSTEDLQRSRSRPCL